MKGKDFAAKSLVEKAEPKASARRLSKFSVWKCRIGRLFLPPSMRFPDVCQPLRNSRENDSKVAAP